MEYTKSHVIHNLLNTYFIFLSKHLSGLALYLFNLLFFQFSPHNISAYFSRFSGWFSSICFQKPKQIVKLKSKVSKKWNAKVYKISNHLWIGQNKEKFCIQLKWPTFHDLFSVFKRKPRLLMHVLRNHTRFNFRTFHLSSGVRRVFEWEAYKMNLPEFKNIDFIDSPLTKKYRKVILVVPTFTYKPKAS